MDHVATAPVLNEDGLLKAGVLLANTHVVPGVQIGFVCSEEPNVMVAG